MSQTIILRDIYYLEIELSKSRKNYGQRPLFSTYESTLLGVEGMIKKLWSMIDSKNTEDKERIKAITLIAQYYRERVKLIKSESDLLSNKKYIEKLQIFNP